MYESYLENINIEKEIGMSQAEAKQQIKDVNNLVKNYLQSWSEYCKKTKNENSVVEWLQEKIHSDLPELSEKEIIEISNDISERLQVIEENQQNLEFEQAKGRSTESWLSKQIKLGVSSQNLQDSINYVNNLNKNVLGINDSIDSTVFTKAGLVNHNPSLDGFLAEEIQAAAFNMEAAAKGSPYRARVHKADGVFGKNSVDVSIDKINLKTGDIEKHNVRKYQLKYGATAKDTIRMIEAGNYKGQRLIVPVEQVEEVQAAFPKRKVEAMISIGNVKGKELGKIDVKDIQNFVQSGGKLEYQLSDYEAMNIAQGVSKEIGKSVTFGVAMGIGNRIVDGVVNNENLDAEDIVKAAIDSGVDTGVKTVVTGALTVASVTKLIKFPKFFGPAEVAYAAVENVKIAGKVAIGEMDAREGIDAMQTVSAACVGAALATGLLVTTLTGPVGFAVSAVAGTVGSMVGSTVSSGYQKIRDDYFTSAAYAVSSAVDTVIGGVRDFFSNLWPF